MIYRKQGKSAAAVGSSIAARLRLLLLACAAALCVAACAGSEEAEDAFVRDITEAYRTAQQALENGNYRRAIQIYEALQARFPFSEFATQIQLELMYAYYKSGQKEQAIEASDTFVRENPTHSRVDYALYVKGLTYFEENVGALERLFRKSIDSRPPVDAELAFSTFRRLVERYPASPYAADAELRMIYLRNRLAAYENTVARFYLETGAYVAALNRAKTALEQYHGADSGAESLQIMIAAYDALGMSELAADARRVLEENFPGDST